MKIKVALIILNHKPAKELVEELEGKGFQVKVAENVELWGQIPTTTDNKGLEDYLKPLYEEIKNLNKEDIVIINGEPTSIFHLAYASHYWEQDFYSGVSSLKLWAGAKFYAPISERVSKDVPQEDSTIKKISIFKYAGLREYL